MSQELQVFSFDQQQIDVMRRTVAAGTSPEDFLVFLEVCKHRRLNPFAREIYAIVRQGRMTIQVSIDGLRKLAERSGKYRGQVGPQFCGADGVWKDEWLLDTPPTAARVGVKRADFDAPVWAVARYKAYVQESSPTWKKMPDIMTAKCAEALALRKAFPDEMSGLYAHEEMAQAGKPDNDAFKRPVEQPASAIIETTAVAAELTVEQVYAAFLKSFRAEKWEAFKTGVIGFPVADEGLSESELARLMAKLDEIRTANAGGGR